MIYSVSIPSVQECIIVDKSLIPLERYYLTKFDKWKKYIIRCKVCNRLFMANTLRFQLCSAECIEQVRLDNLAKRKENEAVSSVDRICKAARAYWNNRLDRIKVSNEWSCEDVQKYEAAKDNFLDVCREKRKEHKNGNITFDELRNWLLHQEVKAQEVLEALMVTKR